MAELDNNVNTQPETTETEQTVTEPETTEVSTESAELAKLRAEMARMKAANDKLAKENSEKTKQLRAKQSAEEVAQEEAKALQQSMKEELEQLRKEKAVAETSKKVLTFIGDETTANTVAEYLYGAEDADAALTAINKAWTAKEKALRLEYGKITAPGAGSADGPTITREQLDAMTYTDRVKYANEHPNEYNQLMGR